MQPNRTTTHIDQALTDFSLAFLQDPSDFIARTVLPIKVVSKQSNKYFKYSTADARDDAKLRIAGSESDGSGFSLSTDSYFAEKYALHVDLTYDDIANADDPIDLEKDSIAHLAQAMLIRHEKLFAAACWATGVWTESITGAGTTKWNDYSASNPIGLIDQAKRGVHLRSFKNANTLILGQDVALALKEHPDFVSRIQYTSDASIDTTLMARRLGVERVLVAQAIWNQSGESKTTASMGFVLDPKSALLLYSPPSIGTRTVAGAVSFAWSGEKGLPRPMGVVSRRFDMPERQSMRIESELCVDVKVTAPDAGVFLAGIVD